MSYVVPNINHSSSFWINLFLSNRALSGFIIILIYLAVASLFAYLISDHIAKIYRGEKTSISRYTDKFVIFFEKIIGEESKKEMKFREYFKSLIIFNAIAGIIAFIFLYFENMIPFNHSSFGMNLSLTVNTVVSFLTNTNLQHYSNPLRLTYFSQTFVLIGLMYLAPATAFAASMAFVRGILTEKGNLGNFYHDFLISIFELFLPLSLLITIFLILLGIPETTLSVLNVHPFFSGSTVPIPLGSVASWESIKNLGTNGGGFYGANAAFPLENPNWITNMIEFTSFILIPLGSIISLGKVFEKRQFGQMLFGVIMAFFILGAAITFIGEYVGIPALSSLGITYTGNLVGKETSLGIAQSSIFAVGATMTSTGASNGALISYTPLGILGVLVPLLMNDPLGGAGTSVLNIFTFVIFTAFIASLMVGRLPEIMRIKLGSREIKYSTLSLITHPLIVMIPLGFTLAYSFAMGTFVNSQPDRITSLLYEYTSSASNNGSEIGGFLTNQAFFNYMDSVIMLLGRYLIIGFQLVIAQSLSAKAPKAEGENAVRLGSFPFAVTLFSVMIIVGLLSFFPVLVLGPLLSLARDFGLVVGEIL